MISVPVVTAARVSPAKNPVPIDTLADLRTRLSTSYTITPDEAATGGPPWVKVTVLPAPAITGAWSTPTTVTSLPTVLEARVPSFTVQVRLRNKSDPKFVGFVLPELKVTDSSTCW